MGDPHDGHDQPVVYDRVENPVPALTEPVLVGPRELLTAGRTWVVRQGTDAVDDSSLVFLRRDRLDFFDGGGLDEEPIPCHAA